MKTNKRLFLASLLITFFSFSQQKKMDTIRVFYLGGQSNMDGYGYVKELPDSLMQTFKDVWIFHGNDVRDNELDGGLGIWEQLKPGHGASFKSNGIVNRRTKRFGVEMSFAKRMQNLYPNEKIAIIKHSRPGSSIHLDAAGKFGSWDPDFKGKKGINQYDNFLKTIRGAFGKSDINNDGIQDYLKPSGIIWMQGESDAAYSEEIALSYEENLKKLMDLIRAALRVDDLPVVIGKISDSQSNKTGKVWKYGELVQYAQEQFVNKDANAAIIRATKNYGYTDYWHYNSEGYIDLGIRFANAVFELNKE